MEKMNIAVFIAAASVCLFAAALASQETNCKKFGDFTSDGRVKYRCDEECLKPPNNWRNTEVYGTLAYSQNSSICLSGVHAGVIYQPGDVEFIKDKHYNAFQSTFRNGVVSMKIDNVHPLNKEAMGYQFVSPPVQRTDDFKPDLIMLQFKQGNKIQSYCASDQLDHEDIRILNIYYKHPKAIEKEIEVFSNGKRFNYNISKNLRYYRCMTNSTSPVASLRTIDFDAKSLPFRITKSLNDSLTLNYSYEGFTKKLPNPWNTTEHPTRINLPFNTPLHSGHSGLYVFYEASKFSVSKEEANKKGQYVDLYIRDCPDQQFGRSCSQVCPDCLNGGECDPTSGRCVCSPGYYGPHCSHLCLSQHFGSRCQWSCNSTFSSDILNTRKDCKGFKICLRDPLGCTCYPGYKGRTCSQECGRNEYGPQCKLECAYCQDKDGCDNLGRCKTQCKNDAPCDHEGKPLNLPRFRSRPNVAVKGDIIEVDIKPWNKTTDDGTLIVKYNRDRKTTASIQEYIILVKDFETKQIRNITHVQTPSLVELTGDLSIGKYIMEVIIKTTLGTASRYTNHRVLTSTFYYRPKYFTFWSHHHISDNNITLYFNQSQEDYLMFTTGSLSNIIIKDDNIFVHGLTSYTTYYVTAVLNQDLYNVHVSSRQPRGVHSSSEFRTLPERPKQVTVEAITTAPKFINVKWSVPSSSPHATHFNVSLFVRKHLSCTHNQDSAIVKNLSVTEKNMLLKDLVPYTKYELLIVPVNKGGRGEVQTADIITNMTDPNRPLFGLYCSSSSSTLTCRVYVENKCKDNNGPDVRIKWILIPSITCNTSLSVPREEDHLLPDSRGYVNREFKNLYFNTDYIITVQVVNMHGQQFSKIKTEVKTKEDSAPSMVKISSYEFNYDHNNDIVGVTLYWNQPCPNGLKIYYYYIKHDMIGWQHVEESSKCKNGSDEYCTWFSINQGSRYTFEIQGCYNYNRYCSSSSYLTIEAKRLAPSRPQLHLIKKQPSEVELSITIERIIPNENTRCFVSLSSSNIFGTCKAIIMTVNKHTCQINQLKGATEYTIKSHCRNNIGDGEASILQFVTQPNKPKILQQVQIKNATNSTLTIILPDILKPSSDVSTDYEIFVKAISSDDHSFNNSPEDSNKASSPNICEISGMETNQKYVVIGDTGKQDFKNNCRLKLGQSYSITVAITHKINDLVSEEATSSKFISSLEDYKAAEPSNSSLPWVLALVILIIMLALIIAVLYKFRSKIKKSPVGYIARYVNNEEDNEVARQVQDCSASNRGLVNHGSANLAMTENNRLANDNKYDYIQVANLQSFLMGYINSKNMLDEFQNIPKTFEKSMNVADLSNHAKKNRYKNNHPYDDTRVKLCVKDSDPTASDYINASHIQSFSPHRRYIASQGPKDENNSTIADFYQMIIEQKVTHIIMIANFIEGNKKKVGLYFDRSRSLQFDQFTIETTTSESYGSYIVSTITIHYEGLCHTVTHYQFLTWPDHGIPSGCYDVCNMVKHIQQCFHDGCVIVHCSAGIGRTGTLLMILHALDMMKEQERVNFIHILKNLRLGRPRLIEDINQFNFAIMVLEQFLYEDETSYKTCSLDTNWSQLHKKASTEFKNLRCLPDLATYNYSSSNAIKNLNRNNDFLPPDQGRLYLEVLYKVEESQYINAVRLSVAEVTDSVITTEYPMAHTVDRFWRLVLEKNCKTVIILKKSNLDAQNYPEILPEKDTTIDLKHVQVQSLGLVDDDALPYYKIHVSDKYNAGRANIYVHENWKDDQPKSSLEKQKLLSLCQNIIISKLSSDEPIVICCWDGVTGCGLTTALIHLIHTMRQRQVIDIYRTCLNLRRQRPQFITSFNQYKYLIEALKTYYNDYMSTYANLS